MKIEEICEYLNELGILSIKNTPLFLSIFSGIIGNNSTNTNKIKNNNIENNKLIILLFAFLKKIISNDKELYELCSNIIRSHTKNKLIKQYQGICFLNKVLFYQIKDRYNHFLFLLFKKKYPKRKYYPYNPSYAAKSVSKLNEIKPNISFTNSNTQRKNNVLNINDDNSLSYISNKNNNKHYNKIIFNTGSDEGNKSEKVQRINTQTHPQIHTPDLVEKMNLKKKEISMNNMKKKLYDAQIRINNYENIMPISRRNRKKEMKSREEEDYYNKLKEDKIYQKLTEKEIDKNNILDRLYRKEIIKKHENKIKEKENIKRAKSPIDWDKVNSINSQKKYLNININSQDINSIKEIINKPKKNNMSSREMFSFGNPVDKEKYKFNQNQNNNNDDKIDYNDFIKNKKDFLYLNQDNNKKIINDNEQNGNEQESRNSKNNINNNNYLDLKQLDENQIEENFIQNQLNNYDLNLNINNKNNPQFIEKYSFGKPYVQNNINSELPNNEKNGNNRNKEIQNIPQENQENNEEQQKKKYNLPQRFIAKNNNNEENQGNEEEENEVEELIYNNNLAYNNIQNEYQNENNNEGEGEEELDNEEYQIENEEIEFVGNNMHNNIPNDYNNININENDKIGNENINYEEVLGENIDEYLDEEEHEK